MDKALIAPGAARFKHVAAKYGVFIALVLICLVIQILAPRFLSIQNVTIILRQISINGVLAVGVTYVIICGGIDLSLGSVVALTGVIAAMVAQHPEGNVFFPVLAGIAAGVLIGAINGLVITRGRTAPFIVTLGMMTIARGAALVISDGRPVSNLSPSFNFISGGEFFFIPIPILIFAVTVLLSIIVLEKMRIGRYIYAVGGNVNAAKASGINVRSVKMFAYIVCSALAGLAGVMLASRITTGQPNAGIAYELDAIAAVVIGGASLSGGVGRITGTVLGVLIIGVINNGLDLLNISSYYQQIIKGLIIISAVLIDRKNSQRD